MKSKKLPYKYAKVCMEMYLIGYDFAGLQIDAYFADGYDTFETGIDIHYRKQEERTEAKRHLIFFEKQVKYIHTQDFYVATYDKNIEAFVIEPGWEISVEKVNEVVDHLIELAKERLNEQAEREIRSLENNKKVAEEFMKS